MPGTPEARLKIVAENLARAALAELKRDVGETGTAAGGASVGFGRMVFQHGQLIASTGTARHGLNILENGLRTLAFSAAGVPGPVGKIVSGFGLLGAGSLVVTGLVAGVGAAALGYRVLTRDAREASEAADKLTDSLKKQTTGGQLRAIGANLTEAGAGVASAQSKVAAGGGTIWEWIAMIRQGALEDAGEKAVAAVMAVRDARATSHADLAKQLEHEADLVGTTAAEAARLKAGWLGLTDAETANYVAAATRLERRKEENRVLEAQKDLLQEIGAISREVSTFGAFAGPDLAGLKLPDIFAEESARQSSLQISKIQEQGGQFGFGLDQNFFDQVQADVDAATGSFEKASAGAKDLGSVIVQSFFQATQAIATGTPAGILGGAGAILGGVSHLEGLSKATAGGLGIAGLVASGLGSVISLFDRHDAERERREAERHRELIAVLHEGPQRVTNNFYGADGTAAEYEVGRRQRLGRDQRLGG